MTSPDTRAAPVLVAVDFSPHSRHAAQRARHFAQQQCLTLHLLHVLPDHSLAQLRQWLGVGHEAEARLRDEARAHLATLAAELPPDGPAPGKLLATGAPVDEILRQADALDAALLVLGARGTGYLRRLVLGSTVERLLRRTRRPLLVVRQTPHEPYRRVLVAVDFSPWSAAAVMLARQLAPQAALLVASVFQVPFEEKLRFAGVDAATIEGYRQRARAETTQRLHALVATAGLAPSQWEPCVLEGDASLRLVELEQERDCDLVVLGKHGVSAAVDLLLGSTTKHVLAEGSVDVLVSTACDG
ncbi:MAG: universal stress protein [Betaproteobacteria bacterium]|nr:universal stress protein [Betaproteobacteria bacterium]